MTLGRERVKVSTFNAGMRSSFSPHWRTPPTIYQELDREFHFTLDPCPEYGLEFGLELDWTGRVFVNPPYGRRITDWIKKGYESNAEVVVMLLPARTDTAWWHDYCMKGEIRFIRGRLKFNGALFNAPFPSAVVVFRK